MAAVTTSERLRQRILLITVIVVLAGFEALAIYSVAVTNAVHPLEFYLFVLETLGTLVLVAGASCLVGVLLGFLFGVPKTLQGTATPETGTGYKVNTSLEEISDWLTKMIIGVGLVELKQIPAALMTLNEYVARTLPAGYEAEPVVGATVVFYGAAGILLGYLSTRLYVSRAFKEADDEITKLKAAAGEANDVLQTSGTPAPDSVPSRHAAPARPEVANDPRVKNLVAEAERTNVEPRDLSASEARSVALAYFVNQRYQEALPYFQRAGADDLTDDALAIQYAIALGESDRRGETVNRRKAVELLEKMVRQDKGLPAAYKLLGYMLLWFRDRLDQSIDSSIRYRERVPSDSGATFNIACAYAQSSTKPALRRTGRRRWTTSARPSARASAGKSAPRSCARPTSSPYGMTPNSRQSSA